MSAEPIKIKPPGMLPGLQPLGADVSTQGLRPISVTEGSGPPTRRDVDVVAEGNPVEEFLAEHPETDADRAVPTDIPETDASEPDAPSVEADATPSATPTVPADAPSVNAETPATEPGTAPSGEAKPVDVEPTKPTYSFEEKFALGANADGTPVEWTRGQLVDALRERVTLQPLATETEKWRGLFNGDFAKAEADWKPLLSTLRDNPDLTHLFDSTLRDPQLAEYLQRSALHFENERALGNVPATEQRQAPQPQMDPATAERIARLEARIANDDRQRNLDRANQEIAGAISQFPFLAQDRAALTDLVQTADYLHAQNPAWGMKEAIAAKRSMYEAVTFARAAQQQQVAPAQPAPPALLGSGGGASPGGTRGVDTGRRKKFDDPQDAVEDWIRTHPQ